MKVLVAHNRYVSANPSGENAVVDQDIALLGAAGVEVVPYVRSSDEIGGLPLRERAALPVSALYARRGVRDVAALIDEHRPDVLHLHNPYPLVSPAVVLTAKRRGVPVVQSVHNHRHACLNGVLFRDGHPCTECVSAGSPLPGVVHGCYRGSRAQSAALATSLVVHRPTWRQVDRYLALTPVMAEQLSRTIGPGAPVEVKPNCVPDPGPPQKSGGTGLLFAGRLSEEKGVDLLLSAWAARSSTGGTLTIAGDGPLRDSVASFAAGRPDVEYVGLLDRSGVQEHLRRAVALVMPSVCPEVCPMIVLEALAAGRPVLAAALGGLPWLVGEGGWTAAPEPGALAAVLDQVLASPEDRAERAEAARRRYLSTFAPARVVEQLVGIYEDVRERSADAGSLAGA